MNFLRSALLIPSLISMAFAGEEEGYFSPAVLKIVQHLPTPLREEALSFQSSWQPLSRDLPGNYFAQYIDTIVNEDGIGKSLRGAKKMPLYDSVPFENAQVQGTDWEDFWFEAGEKLQAQALKEKNNPFSLYFLGVFTFYGYAPLIRDADTEQNRRAEARRLLNEASEKHYVRATRFLLKEEFWDILEGWNEHPITKSILETRELEILEPHSLIFQHIKINETNGSTSYKDINTLKKLLDLLPGEPGQYNQILSL
jgi:hypothetical protein